MLKKYTEACPSATYKLIQSCCPFNRTFFLCYVCLVTQTFPGSLTNHIAMKISTLIHNYNANICSLSLLWKT